MSTEEIKHIDLLKIHNHVMDVGFGLQGLQNERFNEAHKNLKDISLLTMCQANAAAEIENNRQKNKEGNTQTRMTIADRGIADVYLFLSMGLQISDNDIMNYASNMAQELDVHECAVQIDGDGTAALLNISSGRDEIMSASSVHALVHMKVPEGSTV